VAQANTSADKDSSVVRVSIDSKAKVKVGNLSRQGADRRRSAPKANDHDIEWETSVLPFGILNMNNQNLDIYMSESAETSDFVVDCLDDWWVRHREQYPEVRTLAIDLDGGMATRSNRTQFIKRIVEFSRTHNLRVVLIYYPPYHSKYNPIERVWAALEQFWNGAIIDSVEAVLGWAANMQWNGKTPTVHHITESYEKNVKVDQETLANYLIDWHPSDDLPKWAVTVEVLIG